MRHPAADLPQPTRVAAVDAARGAALAGMFAYHFTWDLGYFRFVDADLPLTTPFRVFADLIASGFLVLVGVSLVLAVRRGIRWPAYLERLVWIVAAATVISLATWFLFPGQFIYFGILHCIAVASVVAAPFVRWPSWLAPAACIACFVASPLLSSHVFDRPSLWWLGLGVHPPDTLDYRPVFPWLGMVFAGVALAGVLLPMTDRRTIQNWRPGSIAGKTLVWGGRHSLLVYLIHQPVFLAVLLSVTQIAGPAIDAAAQPFLRACEARCVGAGAPGRMCGVVCSCIAGRSQASGLWPHVLANGLSPQETKQFAQLQVDCVRSFKSEPAS